MKDKDRVVNASAHLVFDAARPVLRIALDAEGLARGRPSAAADDGLPGIRGGSDYGRHRYIPVLSSVPKMYRRT